MHTPLSISESHNVWMIVLSCTSKLESFPQSFTLVHVSQNDRFPFEEFQRSHLVIHVTGFNTITWSLHSMAISVNLRQRYIAVNSVSDVHGGSAQTSYYTTHCIELSPFDARANALTVTRRTAWLTVYNSPTPRALCRFLRFGLFRNSGLDTARLHCIELSPFDARANALTVM